MGKRKCVETQRTTGILKITIIKRRIGMNWYIILIIWLLYELINVYLNLRDNCIIKTNESYLECWILELYQSITKGSN